MTSLDWNDFYAGLDPRTVRMENELLRLENRSLKARAGEKVSSQGSLSGDSDGMEDGWVRIRRSEYEALRRAKFDLRWLLRKLDRGPARLTLRRFRGWKTLVDRHLDGM